jgi:hypothetical protein
MKPLGADNKDEAGVELKNYNYFNKKIGAKTY